MKQRFSLGIGSAFLLGIVACSGAKSMPSPPPTPGEAATLDGRSVYKVGESEIDVQTTGHVRLDPDSEPLFDLHGDGSLQVRERSGSDVRVLTARRDEVVWRVNGSVRPFDGEGKAWLRKILVARPQPPAPPPSE